MWNKYLENLASVKKNYDEILNSSALEQEINVFKKEVITQLNINLKDEYLAILRVVNGFEFNGFILYGIDENLLENEPNEHISGFIENNLLWQDEMSEFVFFAESDIAWFVMRKGDLKYYELDKPSGEIMVEFSDFYDMISNIIRQSLG